MESMWLIREFILSSTNRRNPASSPAPSSSSSLLSSLALLISQNFAQNIKQSSGGQNKKSELLLTRRATASTRKGIRAQFALEISVWAWDREKFTKSQLFFRFQGRSRLSMLGPSESLSAVLAVISNKSVSICNRFEARRITVAVK